MNLESEPICGLVADGTLTLEQAMALDLNQRMALNDELTRERLRNGELTIENIIDAGQDVELGKLPSFQKALSESEGYCESCSAAMKSYRVFSKMNRENPDHNDDKENDTPTPK